MNWRIDKISVNKICDLRKEYFNSLPEYQELYLELMIKHSDCFIILVDNFEAGYGIRNTEGILIEYYLRNQYWPISPEIFKSLLKELSIRTIYCKSFDHLLLINCLTSLLSYSLIGALYRDYATSLEEKDSELIMEKADNTSIDLLFSQDHSIRELFETREQLNQFINDEHVFTFSKNGELVGCGMVIRTTHDREFCDLGVWVHPLYRMQGIATCIIMSLREYALKNHMKPSCGCAIENIGSQKAIEKSGFVSRHRLIKFNVT